MRLPLLTTTSMTLALSRQRSLSRLAWVGTVGVALLLTGCVEKRDAYHVPEVPLPDHFAQDQKAARDADGGFQGSDDGSLPRAASGETLETHSITPTNAYTKPLEEVLPTWWTLFGSAELNRLVDQTLARNPDIHVVALQVEQAETQYEQAFADELPVVTAPVEARVDAPADGTGTVLPGASVTSERSFSAGVRVDYRLDVWGERRATTEAARLRVWQAVLTRDNTKKTIIADLVGTYIDYLALNDRLKVAYRSRQVLAEMLAAVRERLERGDSTILDLAQQRAAVRGVEATIPALQLQVAQATHRIAQLTGTTAAQLQLSGKGLDSLKLPAVMPGVPSSLLLRRPDVRAAEANLLAADADVDVARAQVLPTVDLSAELGKGANYFYSWLQPESLFWNLVGSLTATLFDYGAREERVKQQQSRHEELVEAYVSSIYNAVRETEDALARLNFGTQRQLLQQEATDASAEAVEHSRESYRYGATDYLTLLDTERTYHTSSDELFQVTQDRYRGAIDLFVALGGGVELGPRLPGEGERPQDRVAAPDASNGGIVMLPQEDGQDAPMAASVQAPTMEETGNIASGLETDVVLEGKPIDVTGMALPEAKPVRFGPTRNLADMIERESLEKAQWVITLPGLFSEEGLHATWRNLQEQFGPLLEGLELAPVLLDDTNGSNDLGRQWYKLVIGPFATQTMAQETCASLGRSGVRCQSMDPTF